MAAQTVLKLDGGALGIRKRLMDTSSLSLKALRLYRWCQLGGAFAPPPPLDCG